MGCGNIKNERLMENLSKKEKEFVALGAALGSNCVPCIIYHIKESRKSGISDEQIRGAIELAEKVRKVPAEKVLNTAYAQLENTADKSTQKTNDKTSGCGF